MNDRIERTILFLKENLANNEYLYHRKEEMSELLEHSLRVANIGAVIASREYLNEEAVIIGCLLHEISCFVFAKPFLKTLDLSDDIIDEICHGISTPVNGSTEKGNADTLLTKTIRDANQIDYIDVASIYENLHKIGFSRLSINQKEEKITIQLSQLEQYRNMEFSTKTAKNMWKERVEFQISFYIKMALHLKDSQAI